MKLGIGVNTRDIKSDQGQPVAVMNEKTAEPVKNVLAVLHTHIGDEQLPVTVILIKDTQFRVDQEVKPAKPGYALAWVAPEAQQHLEAIGAIGLDVLAQSAPLFVEPSPEEEAPPAPAPLRSHRRRGKREESHDSSE